MENIARVLACIGFAAIVAVLLIVWETIIGVLASIGFVAIMVVLLIVCLVTLEHIREKKAGKREIPEERRFTYWHINEAEDCGLCDPPLDSKKAMSFMIDYLLGPGWYVAMPESHDQVIAAAVHQILCEYSPEYRRERKRYEKSKKTKQ